MKDIATIATTKEILEKYQLGALKKFGQNFLIDINIIDKIITSVDINKKTAVIEVGPGIGALTQRLALQSGKVISFEIDERFKPVYRDYLNFDNLNIIFGDFFSHTIDYLVNGLDKPQLSSDSIDKLKEVANFSLESHINLMLESEELEIYIQDFADQLTEIVPQRHEVIGKLPIASIQTFLNFNQLYLYLLILGLLIIITFCLWSIYKPLKYLAIPMIVSGVLFAILGSMNNFINDYVISNLEGLKPLISPLITILLTIVFKVGVLISFSGVFLMIIYVVINRIVINNHKTK